ncbi:VIT domain-containing protein [Planctomycetota bacterium]
MNKIEKTKGHKKNRKDLIMKWPFKRTMCLVLLMGHLQGLVLQAQEVPPVLMVNQPGFFKKMKSLGLQSVDVDVRIVGYLAETCITMTFYNGSGRVLSGDLYFPLPEGATVSGYALDVNGKMVEGVVVEKGKARQVFEKEERKGVDPGLVEWVKGNNFKTRIFPIPAKGTRTVKVKYVTELVCTPQGAVFHLPLNFEKKIEKFSLRVEAVKASVTPRIKKGGLANFRFKKWRDSFVAEIKQKNVRLTDDMLIALPDILRGQVMVEKAPDGQTYFGLFDFPALPGQRAQLVPERITLLWDASGSRGKRSHKQELEVLKAYFASMSDAQIVVDVVVFRHLPETLVTMKVKNGDCSELIEHLSQIAYDGGTQMGTLIPQGLAESDFYLMFTDGLSTFGQEEPTLLDKPLYILSADPSSNHAFLRYLAVQSGGDYIHLNRVEKDEAVDSVGQVAFSFLTVSGQGVRDADIYPSMPRPVHGHLFLAGKLLRDTLKLRVQYGNPGDPTVVSEFEISRKQAGRGDLLRRYWAQKKVDELSIHAERNKDQIVAIGKQYGIVTPGTSLIVLESLAQYLEHAIRPPDSLRKMQKDYDRQVAGQSKEIKSKEEDKISRILALWNKRIAWWETDFDNPQSFKHAEKGEPGNSASALASGMTWGSNAAGGLGALAEANAFEQLESHNILYSLASNPTVRVRESGFPDELMSSAQNTIVLQERIPNTPYLKALKKANGRNLFKIYMKQRKQYSRSPAFYLDCSKFLLAQGQAELALQVLSNIAELELENAALLRVLAHRLAQLGELDYSIDMFEKVLDLRPEEPQSYRDLALVLAQKAENLQANEATQEGLVILWERVIELLNHVVINEWDRFYEVEVIALMELNRLIPKAKAVGLTNIPMDPRLIKMLDVDVRIVMTWDADLTDIDLWVTEPSGEKALYSHPRTRIGGHMSRDFTQGYGPEEYLLKKAMPGMYTIEANYYGSSAPKIIGAVTLQLDIFTNYGRSDEQHKAITLRLEDNKETVKVGEIEF